jgi:excinuclease ABC subunit C
MSSSVREILLEKARSASRGPGVYRMLDQSAKVLYVGKSKSLASRVSTYFASKIEDDKTRILASKIRDFETILTESEAEALILEAILIKKHKPRYNIQLRDDKSYPYVIVDKSHSFPRLIYARKPKKTKGLHVYGPYAVSSSLRDVVRFLNATFKLRDCSDMEFQNRSRPCINYQIGICSGPCTNLITQQEYSVNLQQAAHVLEGKGQSVMQDLKNQIQELSEQTEFERAARIRDQLRAIEETVQRSKQSVDVQAQNINAIQRDAVGWHRSGEHATISLLFFRNGNLVDTASFHFEGLGEQSDQEVIATFLAQFYLTSDQEDVPAVLASGDYLLPGAEIKTVPKEILLPFDFSEKDLFAESLITLGHDSQIILPQRGVKADQLQLANKNAENAFTEHQREKGNVFRVLGDLKVRLRLENYPRRMECFDISNLGDTGIVASRVVFIEGKPDKTLYRHYKIRGQDEQNDFAAMREVLSRRLSNSLEKEERPDLLVVDGGKGQLAQAVEVMRELNVTGIDVVALAKSKTEYDASDRVVLKSAERIFKPGRSNPIALAPDSQVCHLLQRLRDEAHRFAVNFQRSQRDTSRLGD